MNKIKQLMAILSFVPAMCAAQTTTENYVKTMTMLDASGTNSVKAVQYYNGLGYPTVSVATTGGNGETTYSLTTYDALGREACKYLPVADANKSLLYKSSDDIINMSSTTNNGDKTAYSQNHYDALDRITSVELPGQAWRDNDRRNVSVYSTNAKDEVLHYVANPNGKQSLMKPDDSKNPYQYYPAGSLTKETSSDADGKKVETFKDLFGNVILQRTVLDNTTNLDTYYVYDAIGQLCYVLSPLYQKNGKKAITAFEYRYDNRGRVEKKFLPGAGYIRYWYDNADRIIGMQDSMMRKDNVYRFTFYDNLGRMVVQGLTDYLDVPSNSSVIAKFIGQGGVGDTGYRLSYDALSKARSITIEVVNYYDNYDFSNSRTASCFDGLKDTTTVSQIGYLTGSLTLCGNDEYLSQVMEYDIKGNLLKTTSREIGGRTVVNNSTYTFTNNVESSTCDIDAKQGEHVIVNEAIKYNKYNNKKEESTLSISHGDVKAQSTMTYAYDDLGRLASVSRPSSSVDYKYEMHGWLESISTNSFRENLYYANCFDTIYSCFNGNISAITWQNNDYTKNDKIEMRGYTFTYDGANRLTDALYGERESLYNHKNRYNEVVRYDANGNITHLERRGKKQDGEYGKVDNLNISYLGNQLSKVEEDAKDFDYDGNIEYKGANGSKYVYNGNGSLIADKSRGIAYIAYDYSNNPTMIYFTNGNTTEYVYSATGQKVRVIYNTAKYNVIRREVGKEVKGKLHPDLTQLSDTTDYLLGGSLVMKNGKVDKFLFEGGYAQAEEVRMGFVARPITFIEFEDEDGNIISSSQSKEESAKAWDSYYKELEALPTADNFRFYYYNQDHLGNNREVVDEGGQVVQVTNYYPFGATYADASGVKDPDLQQYKYNGKELDRMHGLNTYDYGARQHDPILGRWDRVDPLCEKYYSTSPYAYCRNNPVIRIDVDGLYDTDNMEKGGSYPLVVVFQNRETVAADRSLSAVKEAAQSFNIPIIYADNTEDCADAFSELNIQDNENVVFVAHGVTENGEEGKYFGIGNSEIRKGEDMKALKPALEDKKVALVSCDMGQNNELIQGIARETQSTVTASNNPIWAREDLFTGKAVFHYDSSLNTFTQSVKGGACKEVYKLRIKHYNFPNGVPNRISWDD